jgi:hypothetical protein
VESSFLNWRGSKHDMKTGVQYQINRRLADNLLCAESCDPLGSLVNKDTTPSLFTAIMPSEVGSKIISILLLGSSSIG